MRTYEIMCVSAPQDEDFNNCLSEVKKQFSALDADIQEEKDMGVKTLAYHIQSHTHARYFYFIAKMLPEKAHALRNECRLIAPLLRILVIRKDN